MRANLAGLMTPLLSAALLVACGGDAAGTSPVVTDLDPALVAALCVRGDLLVGGSVSGAVSAGDCDLAQLDTTDTGYYDAWRLRVSAAGSVTISTSSTIDTYLAVFRLDDWDGSLATLTPIGEDDDSGPTFNALLTVSLEADRNYMVLVSGFDYPDVGDYTVTAQ